jgi:HEPN domain-containing protein
MMSVKELTAIARARLKDAEGLFSLGRYDAATYICGYAVEIALKVRIVKTLKWAGFPSTSKEFEGLQSFRSHDLERLLYLCGKESTILAKFSLEWADVCQWDPERRYSLPGQVSRPYAEAMIENCRKIIGALL